MGRNQFRDTTDDALLARFGYKEELKRGMGPFASFALAFALVSVTTTVFTLFAVPFQSTGGIGIWVWLPCIAGVLLISLVYGHLSARMPLTGYAYHWCTRMANPAYGWLTGYNAMLVQFTGTGVIATALASVFAPIFWAKPSHTDTILLAVLVVVAAVIINAVNIKVTALATTVGTATELIGTIGMIALLGVGLFWFSDIAGPGVLVHVGSSVGSPVNLTAICAALLVPAFTIGGWEGCADLSEETHDPRRTAPLAMRRGILISGLAGLISFAILGMAIPGHMNDVVNGTQNPVVVIFEAHFGHAAGVVIEFIAFVSLMSCVLGNLTVASRTGYALARDNMLPLSSLLGRTTKHSKIPLFSILAVGVVATLMCFLSDGLIAIAAGFGASMLYITYGLTVAGALYGAVKNRIPPVDPDGGYFGLGKWLKPACVVSIGWAILIVLSQLAPAANRQILYYILGFEVLGVIWYVFALRQRMARGEAGPEWYRSGLRSGDSEIVGNPGAVAETPV